MTCVICKGVRRVIVTDACVPVDNHMYVFIVVTACVNYALLISIRT